MKRRNFIQTTAATSLPILLKGMGLSALPKSSIFSAINGESDRVLVLIQMNGGNDGLNTIIPLDQYDKLAAFRSNILIPENNLLSLTSETAMHPAMTGLKSLYDDAKLGIIQSVGYPNQNRSHFRSSDIWTSGSHADEFLTTGWMGRYFESKFPNYPEDYPNDDCGDPFALTIGSLVSETCQSSSSNYSLALTDPFSPTELNITEPGQIPTDTCYGYELNFVQQAILQTNAYADTVLNAANNGANLATYPEGNTLAEQLKIVSLLIAGGLQTSVYIVNLGGFDTHANQVVEGETTTGEHALLLQTLSDGIAAFQEDLKLLGLQERVIGMTFSEFGRRILSNDSLGTDHGNAAPLMVFGSCVNAAILGASPEIPDQVDILDGVQMQFDFRSIYGSVLMDWFGVTEEDVKNLLHPEFQHLPILQVCNTTSTTDPNSFVEEMDAYNMPNPFSNTTEIIFTTKNEWAKISIFDPIGQEIRVLASRQFSEGEHRITFEAHGLAAGNYYFRIVTKDRMKTKLMVKN